MLSPRFKTCLSTSAYVLIRCAPYMWSFLFGVVATVGVCALMIALQPTGSPFLIHQVDAAVARYTSDRNTRA